MARFDKRRPIALSVAEEMRLRSPVRPSLRGRLRVLASLWLAVAIAAPLASSAHLALVRHVTCAEHGELVEIGAPDGAQAKHAPETRLGALADADSHGHDHCAATGA